MSRVRKSTTTGAERVARLERLAARLGVRLGSPKKNQRCFTVAYGRMIYFQPKGRTTMLIESYARGRGTAGFRLDSALTAADSKVERLIEAAAKYEEPDLGSSVREGATIAPTTDTHKEGTMARVVRSSSKRSGSKASGSKSTASKAKSNGSARRSTEDIDKLIPKIAKALKGGATMTAVKAEFGFSHGNPIRQALARNGYDSKGEKLDVSQITGGGKSLATKVAKERRGGEAWYTLALRTGKSEAELKALLKEHGFKAEASGRTYKTEKAGSRGR